MKDVKHKLQTSLKVENKSHSVHSFFYADTVKRENVVTFLYGISINVYYWLFRKEYSNAPWLFLLNEFSRGTALDQEIHRSLLFPQFVIFAINVTPWDGYEKVENVSPVFGEFKERRDLYVCHRLS